MTTGQLADSMKVMQCDIERVLYRQEQITQRVTELAGQIVQDHAGYADLTIVPILTGGMIFCSDLIRRMPIAMKIGLLSVSSYPGKAMASQGAMLGDDRIGDLAGRHVVVVDDILDSGGTLQLVMPALRARGAASVRSCVLLRKDRPVTRTLQADYVGFDIPDEFVVGYGLDYDDYYRNLPDICTLKRSVYEGKV